MLQLDNLRLLISNMTKFIQSLAQKDLHEAFLVPNFGILIFSRNVAIRQIRRYLFKIRQFCFQIPAQKYPNKAFLVPNLKIFICTKLCSKTNSRTLISNMTIIFSISSPKTRKPGLFGPKFKNFYFLHVTLQQGKFEDADFKYDNGFSKLLPKTHK